MGPVSSSPLWVTVIDNWPCLAIIRQRQSINHFQHKHCRERSFKWGRFYLDNCNYVQQISPKIPGCLHCLKWKRLPFLWLTVGILQILCFVFIAAVVNGTVDDTHTKMPVWFFRFLCVCVFVRAYVHAWVCGIAICEWFLAFVLSCIENYTTVYFLNNFPWTFNLMSLSLKYL